ncbi:MAG: amidase family protein, partial [Acetobacterales bacterium]
MTELCDLGAVDLRRMIGRGAISPVELLDSCIARIEATNPAVNAIVATCFDRGRKEAKAAEEKVRRGEPLGALHGLPVGVKDLNNTAGLRTT